MTQNERPWAQCANNLRQLALAMITYVQENGRYPHGNTNSRSVWMRFGGKPGVFDAIENCPRVGGGVYQPNFYGSGGYGHRPNLGLGSDLVTGALPEGAVVQPSDMIAITDFVFPLFPPRVRAGGPDPGLPHFGGLQFVFCDGHVEHQTSEKFVAPTVAARRRWNNDHEPHPETWR